VLKDRYGGWDRIPAEHPDYGAYAARDVELSRRLAECYPMTAYGRREHRILTIAGQISLRGFRVDAAELGRRLAGQERRRNELRSTLPITEPLATNNGKRQLAAAFERHGVALPRNGEGLPLINRSCMDAILAEQPAGSPATSLAAQVREFNGQRSIYNQIADYFVDGRVHPHIDAGQSTGRWSVTKPGLTTLGKRDGRQIERGVLLPEEGRSDLDCGPGSD